jgi:AcrR family transcriptional regulator
MGRRPGARNADYEATKNALAVKILRAVVRRGAQVSLHDLAREAEVSIPTLKHYFGDRSNAVAEALRTVRESAARYIATVADPGDRDLRGSLVALATGLAGAWVPAGVGQLFASGMSAGLFDEVAGPGYLDGVLEPTVLAMEERLRAHARRGEASLDPEDELSVRTAALAFLSPLLVALIHQHGLSGTKCRPLPVDAFIESLVGRFVAAYGPAVSREESRDLERAR